MRFFRSSVESPRQFCGNHIEILFIHSIFQSKFSRVLTPLIFDCLSKSVPIILSGRVLTPLIFDFLSKSVSIILSVLVLPLPFPLPSPPSPSPLSAYAGFTVCDSSRQRYLHRTSAFAALPVTWEGGSMDTLSYQPEVVLPLDTTGLRPVVSA